MDDQNGQKAQARGLLYFPLRRTDPWMENKGPRKTKDQESKGCVDAKPKSEGHAH